VRLWRRKPSSRCSRRSAEISRRESSLVLISVLLAQARFSLCRETASASAGSDSNSKPAAEDGKSGGDGSSGGGDGKTASAVTAAAGQSDRYFSAASALTARFADAAPSVLRGQVKQLLRRLAHMQASRSSPLA
jgi:hypothetical protein